MTSKKEPRNTLWGRTCYSADEYLDFVEGVSGDDLNEEIETHLRSCKRCRFEVVRLRRALRQADAPLSAAEDAEVEAAGERVRLSLERRRVDYLWNKFRLSQRTAASGGAADWKGRKAILRALGIWKE